MQSQPIWNTLLTAAISVLFSGVVAALLTFHLNRRAAKEDAKENDRRSQQNAKNQQQAVEDWEHRKYEANQRLHSLRTLTELFYAARSEVYFLGLDFSNTEAMLQGLLQATEQMLLENNPQISAKDLAQQKAILTQQQRQRLIDRKIARLDQYNNSVKALLGRAHSEVSVASHYLSRDLQEHLENLLKKIGTKIEVGTAAQVAAVLSDFDSAELELRQIQKGILGELDAIVKSRAANA